MLRFESSRLIFIKDIERSPYVIFSKEEAEWSKVRNKEEILIALERYLFILDYLRKTNQHLKEIK